MNRYAFHYSKVVVRDLQSKNLRLKSMSMPKLTHIDLSISIEESSKILPAMISLELLSGQKPQVKLATVYGKKGSVERVSNTLRRHNMYYFYDNLINIYIPALKKADAFGTDPIAADLDALSFERLLTMKQPLKFTLQGINYLAPIEREFQLFSQAGVKDLAIDVTINVGK